ncbi:hypothetical protein A3770_18p82580 [Chloropicon primus]|uniref:DUF5745 domain-containing protein n=1 Tax=Chloropicon primus TaxID=1764295 RepID=A0A5B8N1M7_9CHLO|nr:hypothetical protein A3770_18p82580 [Chloropicon primus]|eukprot:QDZ25740.1 hypothetical protein A3770_18p82580 [Chloropicon primus]
MASSFHTPPPATTRGTKVSKSSTKKRGGRSSQRGKALKTPLSTLLKKASENRVLRDAKLVSMANHVLASAGLVATVRTPNDVRAVCSSTSVLVASYEAVVGEKITGIIRRPANVQERAMNCDAVIHKLQENVLGTDLRHISGERITQGNLQDTYDLLEILSALGDKWTFATPIKTPASQVKKRSAMKSFLKSAEKPKASAPASLRKKLIMNDATLAEEEGLGGGHMAARASATKAAKARQSNASALDEEDSSSDDTKTLKEKLQELLVSTVQQKRKEAMEEERKKDRALQQRSIAMQEDQDQDRASSKKKVVRFRESNSNARKAATAAAGPGPQGDENKRPSHPKQASKKVQQGGKAHHCQSKAKKKADSQAKKDREGARDLAEMLLVHDKVERYVEFDRAVRKLSEMRFSSGEQESRLSKVAEHSVADSERRMATMRLSWLKSQRAQTRHSMALEEKRSLAQQRGLLHSARVESIKARRFQQRVEQLRRSNESRLESAEVAEFRTIFNKAIECEKEIILDRRREASRERKTNEMTKLRDNTLEREEKLRAHFEALTEEFKAELMEAAKEEKQEDSLKRLYEREERLRISQEREKAMEFLAPLTVDAFSSISINKSQVNSMQVGVKKYMRQMRS